MNLATEKIINSFVNHSYVNHKDEPVYIYIYRYIFIINSFIYYTIQIIFKYWVCHKIVV